MAVRAPHVNQLSKRVHFHGQHLVLEGFTPVTVLSGVSHHFPRRGVLLVQDAQAVDEQRVLVFETQILHEGDGAIGRRQRDHGRLPLLFGIETDGFLQANLEIRVGVVGKLARGIADEGDAYLVHFRLTRSFLLIQLSYLAGQPFQRTRTVSFLRFTTESMRNRSSSVVVTF